MLQYYIQQTIERWIEAGRIRDVIRDDHVFILRYGSRFRNIHLLNWVCFSTFLVLGAVGILLGLVVNWKTVLLFLTVFTLATLLSSIYVLYVVTSRVTINNDTIKVNCFGRTISECTRQNVGRTYRSTAHPSIVIVDKAGKKTRISTQFDGLGAAVAWLSLLSDELLDDSIRKWMREEDQVLGEVDE